MKKTHFKNVLFFLLLISIIVMVGFASCAPAIDTNGNIQQKESRYYEPEFIEYETSWARCVVAYHRGEIEMWCIEK